MIRFWRSYPQGNEAGGHGWRFATTLTFVPEAVDHVRMLCHQQGRAPIPVLAAGGICDPRQVTTNCSAKHAPLQGSLPCI